MRSFLHCFWISIQFHSDIHSEFLGLSEFISSLFKVVFFLRTKHLLLISKKIFFLQFQILLFFSSFKYLLNWLKIGFIFLNFLWNNWSLYLWYFVKIHFIQFDLFILRIFLLMKCGLGFDRNPTHSKGLILIRTIFGTLYLDQVHKVLRYWLTYYNDCWTLRIKLRTALFTSKHFWVIENHSWSSHQLSRWKKRITERNSLCWKIFPLIVDDQAIHINDLA